MNTSANLYKSLYDPSLKEFQAGSGLDKALEGQPQTPSDQPMFSKEMGRTAASAMSAGGSLGSTLTGAGISGMMSGAAAGPYAAAAGLALSLYEQNQQAEAAHDRAVAEEAQNRKNAVQNAINAQVSAARMLSV